MPPPPRRPPYRPRQPQPQPQASYNIASNVTQALRNPYAQASLNQFHVPYSSHYASAYMQSQQVVRTTPEGYTLSSTYDPATEAHYTPGRITNRSSSTSNRGRGEGQNSNRPSNPPRQSIGSWYRPGNSRCSYPRCTFTGSHSSVEIHMMDRHLIYPPNWEKRKKGSEWDADPSLKGKTIPIQGTSIVLNAPDVIEAWVAERKKRWPTAQRVEEKKVKMEEAITRGQLPLMCDGPRGTKRRHENDKDPRRNNKRPQPGPKPRKSSPPQSTPHQVPSRELAAPQPPPLNDSALSTIESVIRSPGDVESENSDDDGPPEIVSSKRPDEQCLPDTESALAKVPEPRQHPIPIAKANKPRREPRLPPRNPFASRPTLLRNLLLPEIRMTVSNLSQAIRFLVDNDFLRDVELKASNTSQNLIEVLDSQNTDEPSVLDKPST